MSADDILGKDYSADEAEEFGAFEEDALGDEAQEEGDFELLEKDE